MLEQQAHAASADERMATARPTAAEPSAFLSTVFKEVEGDGVEVTFDYSLDAIIAGLEASRRLEPQ